MSAVSTTDPPLDSSARFLQRLMAALAHGHRLDDPRDPVICRRWVEILDGIPDGKLFQIIPETLRGLFRDATQRPRLERAGLSADPPLKVEAIAPYVVSFRRFMAARSKPADDEVTRGVIAGLRLELRRLKRQFDHVFDQAVAVEAERERLAAENRELKREVLSLRLERDEAQRQIGEARSKAFRFLRLYLFMLKEEWQRRRQDPIRMVTVEVAIETNLATLEALGWQDQAQKSAMDILGPDLYAAYFDAGAVGDRAATRPLTRATEDASSVFSLPEPRRTPHLAPRTLMAPSR